MADLIYANEKVWKAVQILATHRGCIQDRLIEACHEGLVFVPSSVLPNNAKSLYDDVMKRVTATAHTQTKGAFVPAIRNLTDEEAESVAHRILALAYIVRNAMSR